MVRLLFFSMVLAACTACAPLQQRCEPGDDSALDYASTSSWVCHPGRADDVCRRAHAGVEVLPDGGTIPLQLDVNPDPPADCFYVYPTVDMSPVAAVHKDFSDVADQEATTRIQASRLSSQCRVFAPLYRQVTLGTYSLAGDRAQPCFDTAFADVARAFDAFLAATPGTRPIVLLGHSQGAQNISRLLRERVDGDPALRARVAGVFPLGWPVGTDRDAETGGSSATVPACTEDAQSGCVVSFRTFMAGRSRPTENGRFAEGERRVCVHPGDVAGGGPRLLRGSILNARLRGVVRPPAGVEEGSDTDLLYRDFFSARCVQDGDESALEISAQPATGDARASPVDDAHPLAAGINGSHVLDVQFAMLDLVERVRVMVAAHR